MEETIHTDHIHIYKSDPTSVQTGQQKKTTLYPSFPAPLLLTCFLKLPRVIHLEEITLKVAHFKIIAA